MEDNPFPGSFSVCAMFSSIFCSLTVARGSLSNARKRLHRGEIYSGLKCRKEGYIYIFNLILSVACRDIRCVTTAKKSSLNSPPSEKGRRES